MARKPYDGSINRHTADFSKAGPKGEPASGLAIQRYIKEIDNKKFGAGMTTPDGGEHLEQLRELHFRTQSGRQHS